MGTFKLLIDTNVFIGLEDSRQVDPLFAEIERKSSQHGVRLFIHEAAQADIARDKDVTRRAVSLSKIDKFEQLKGIRLPPRNELEEDFGAIVKPNDEVDVALLHALSINAVDFLVTQDQGIHDRARNTNLSRRVFSVQDVVAWLRQTFEPTQVQLPLVEDRVAHEIDTSDEIFDSLREGYPGFDEWWRTKCVSDHRPCWVVKLDGEIAGLVVRKEETHAEARTKHSGPRILKICTFKVKPKFRGEKLGELLLKQILWFAQKNSYDLTYLTTFPTQDILIRVLEYYGFSFTLTLDSGEHVYEKVLSRQRLESANVEDLFTYDRLNYPRFVSGSPAKAFAVPIQGKYHQKLFPEIALATPLPLFPDAPFRPSTGGSTLPGNTIRKVYLCRAKTTVLAPGDLLLFYLSMSRGFSASQSITSVGVVEQVTATASFEDLVRLTGKRSVFSEDELRVLLDETSAPIKVIDFLLAGHIDPPLALNDLVSSGVFKNRPPQSIALLTPQRFEAVRHRMRLGFAV